MRRPYIILSFESRTLLFPTRTRMVRRYFRSARSLVQFLKRKSVVRVYSLEEMR